MKTILKGHSGRDYPFDFGLNGWCRVEALTGQPISTVFDTMANGTLNATLVRCLLQGTLIDGDTLKPNDIGDVCDDLGNLTEVLMKLTEGIMGASAPGVRPATPRPADLIEAVPAEVH